MDAIFSTLEHYSAISKRRIISDCMQSRSNDRNLILYMSRDGHYLYAWYEWFFPAISDDRKHT